MFAKLLKHEWRATVGPQAGLCAAIISMGILGMANISALIRQGEHMSDLAGISLGLSLMFIYLALVICAAASGILLVIRFYQSRFTDQGYLTFTLPVNAHQNFLAAFVNTLIWSVLTGLSVILAFVLMGIAGFNALGADTISQFKQEFEFLLGDAFQETTSAFLPVLPGYAVQVAVAGVYSIVVAMTCLTVGATLAKKHKILAAIGIYYLISMATSMLQNTLMVSLTEKMDELLFSNPNVGVEAVTEMLKQLLAASLPLQIAMIAGCYILSTQLMKKKLNLN